MASVAQTLKTLAGQLGADIRNLQLIVNAFQNVGEELLEFQRLNKDVNDIYTETRYLRTDGTLKRKHVLSGGDGPDYTNLSIIHYAADGVTPSFEWRYLLTYDAYGHLYARALDQFIDYELNPPVAVVTGGTVVDQGGFRIHIFTASGTLDVADGAVTVDRLMVAGGGGGGKGGQDQAGGGGAGGMRVESGVILSIGTYNIVIGAGGLGNTVTGVGGYSGSDTTMTGAAPAIGGGGGGDSVVSNQLTNEARNGKNGGSGGGAGGDRYYFPHPTAGSGTAGQGYAGGNSYNGSPAASGAAGGGSAGVGGQVNNDSARGAGTVNDFSGSAATFSRGGKAGPGPVDGAANTGDGGDGGPYMANGKNGGSGYLVVRYPLA